MNMTKHSTISLLRVVIIFNSDSLESDCYLVACALGQDLASLPQGDMTEVGEKGLPSL